MNTSEDKQVGLESQLLKIGQAIQKKITKNPQEVYQLIAESVCSATGADCAVIYPYDPSFGEFYDTPNIAAYGLRKKLQVDKKSNKRKGLSARIHQSGEVICEDTGEQEPQISTETPFIAREQIKAFMGISLRVDENILGIFYINYRNPHRFSPEEKRLIRLFGQQAMMAVANSWSMRLADIREGAVTKLKTIGQMLIGVEDLSKTLGRILDEIAQSAQEVLDADMVDLYQYFEDRGEFDLPPILKGRRNYPDLIPTKIYKDDVVAEAVKTGEPQYFHDTGVTSLLTGEFKTTRDENMPAQRFVVREEVVSSAIIPLIRTSETLGVMFINYRTPQFFGDEQKNVIESFATQAAIAIRNARLFELERKKSQTLQEVEQLLEPERVIETVLDQLSAVVKYHSASIQLIQGDSRIQVGGRGFSLRDPLPPEYLSNVSRDPLISKVVQEQRPLVISDVAKHPRWKRTPQTYAINSWIGAPLIFRDQVIGIITVDHKQAGYYTQAAGNAVADFAKEVAPLIHNSHLFTAYDRRVEALTALNEVGQTLTAGLRLQEDEVLQLIAEQTRKLVDAQQMYIALYDEKTETISFKLVIEHNQPIDTCGKKEYQPRTINKMAMGKTDHVILSKKPILHSTPADEEAWYQQPGHRQYMGKLAASHLAVPMIAAEKAIGVMAVYSWDRERAYDELDRQILTSLASQAAIALDNARLFYDVNFKLDALNRLGRALTAGLRLHEAEILELIRDRASELMDTNNMYIALYDEVTNVVRFGLAFVKGKRIDVQNEPYWQPRPAGKGKTEAIIRTRQFLFHPTKAEAEAWYEESGHIKTDEEIFGSWIGVPMVIGEKVLGAIAAYDPTQDYGYDENDLQMLTSLADQAAIALDNARLFYDVNQKLEGANQKLARQVEALTTLNEVNQALTTDLRLTEEKILNLIYEQSRKLTGSEDIFIALYDETTGMIRFGLAKEKGKGQVTYPSRKADMTRRGKTEEIIATRKSVLHKTRQETEEWYKQPHRAEFLGRVQASFLGVPMILGESILGVIAIGDWEREYTYDELHQQVLESMADQAAIALENARLFSELKQLFDKQKRLLEEREQRLERLQQISAGMVEAGLNPDNVLELVAQAANDFSHSDLTNIYLYNEEVKFTRGVQVLQTGKVETIQPDALPEAEDLPAQLAQTQTPVFVGNVGESLESYTFAKSRDLQAFAGLPLVIANRGTRITVGVLFVNFNQPHPFPDDQQEILQHLANQAAVAISHAIAQESIHAKEQLAALGTSAATLQHRLGNTINVILPAVMRLRYRVGDDPTAKEILDVIDRNTLFATEVIRRMQTPLRPEPFVRTNFNSLLREAIQKCFQDQEGDRFPEIYLTSNLPELAAEQANLVSEAWQEITLTVHLDEAVPDTFAATGQLIEVFRVLVENAIKAISPYAGAVEVSSVLEIGRARSQVNITVKDTGKGMNEATQAKLFKQPVPRKEFGQGAGLGLWLSHFIVRSHQGSLRLTASAPGQGSTFLVTLPILDQPLPGQER